MKNKNLSGFQDRIERIKNKQKEQEELANQKRKETFMKMADEQIAMYKALANHVDVALEVIKKFDGKVLNNRLTKAVEAEIKKTDDKAHAKLFMSSKGGLLDIMRPSSSRILNCTSIGIKITADNRIDWAETLDDYHDTLSDKAEAMEEAKYNYDAALQLAQDVCDAIDNYSQNAPSILREYFRDNSVISNKYCI